MNADIIETWLDTYRASGLAAGTIRARANYFKNYCKRLAPINPLDATAADIRRVLADCAHFSPEARKSLLVTLRSFYRLAYDDGLIAVDLAATLPKNRVPRGMPKPITRAALEQARAAADEPTRLMLDLGALAGLRRHEIAQVHADHVTDLGLFVHGKGGVDRLVPIHPQLRDRLAALDGWAFPSPKRHGVLRPGQHASPDYIASRLEAVLPRPWTAHSLRHYFGTAAFDGTHDLMAVRDLLGHASVETTQRYVLVKHDALVAAVRAVA